MTMTNPVTPDPAGLLLLADRVEAASDSAEGEDLGTLNAVVLRALGWRSADGDVINPAGDLVYQVPFVVASLDAATSLFPSGTMYRSGNDGPGPDPSLFFCEAITDAPECHRVRSVAATEALARTACALRARAQSPASVGGETPPRPGSKR